LFDNRMWTKQALEVYETAEQRGLAREVRARAWCCCKTTGCCRCQNAQDYCSDRTERRRKAQPAGGLFLPGDAPADAVEVVRKFGLLWAEDGRAHRSDVKVTSVLEAILGWWGGNAGGVCQGLRLFCCGPLRFRRGDQGGRTGGCVVLVLGDRAGLTPDATCGETRDSADLKLPGVQEDLIRALGETGKPLAAVLITGRRIPALLAEKADAILEAWLPAKKAGRDCGGVVGTPTQAASFR